MKRLTIKIAIVLIFVILLVAWSSGAIFRFILNIFNVTDFSKLESVIIPSIAAISGLALFFFSSAIHFLVVRRVQRVSSATKEIAKGHYDIRLPDGQHDEIGTLYDNFNLMAKELKANEYLSTDFVRNVSHELKTPISSIKGFAELIENGGLSVDETKEYAQIIAAEAERLSTMSRSLLQISSLDSTSIIKKDDTFNVSEQVRGILQVLQPLWEKKNIEFDLDLDESTITSNKELLHQVWQNLISNAIKFSNDNGTISISIKTADNKLNFTIKDNGIGMTEDQLKNVFNQFYVADKSRNKSGSGLGLPIVKKIVEKLDGTISVTSKENNGTQAIVCI